MKTTLLLMSLPLLVLLAGCGGPTAAPAPKRASRNVLHNPSFEQGMRYWNWCGGGASYTPVTDETIRYWTTTGGYHGSKYLILRDTGYPRSAGPAGPRSVPYPTVARRAQRDHSSP